MRGRALVLLGVLLLLAAPASAQTSVDIYNTTIFYWTLNATEEGADEMNFLRLPPTGTPHYGGTDAYGTANASGYASSGNYWSNNSMPAAVAARFPGDRDHTIFISFKPDANTGDTRIFHRGNGNVDNCEMVNQGSLGGAGDIYWGTGGCNEGNSGYDPNAEVVLASWQSMFFTVNDTAGTQQFCAWRNTTAYSVGLIGCANTAAAYNPINTNLISLSTWLIDAAAHGRPGYYARFAYFNKSLNLSEMDFLHRDNATGTYGMPAPPAIAPATETNVTLGATDAYNASRIATFNVSVANATFNQMYSTTTSSLSVNLTGQYWLNYTATSYWPFSSLQTLAASGGYNASMHQVFVTFSLEEAVTGTAIQAFNVTVGTYFNTTANGTLAARLSAGTYMVNWSSQGYYRVNSTQTFAAVTNHTVSNVTGTAVLTAYPLRYLNRTAITDFTVRLNTSTWDENRSTTGTNLTWKYLVNGSYSIRINSTNFFPHVGNLTVHNASTPSWPLMWQAERYAFAVDALTGAYLTGFTVRDQFGTEWNASGNTSVLFLDSGWWNLTMVATGYENASQNFTAAALSNATLTFSVSPLINYSLVDEQTLTGYNVAITSATSLDVFCNNETIHHSFKPGNSSHAYLGVGCDFYLVKVTTTYNGSSYFRTLIPDDDARNVTFYLADLSTDVVVQRILNLVDLTGEYADGRVEIRRFLSGATRNIIQQPWDIEDSVTLYLMQNELYTVHLFDNSLTRERSLGNIIADAAGTQTITFPEIAFWPEVTIGDLVSWTYDFNATAGYVRVSYQDAGNTTTQVRFTTFNSTYGQLSLLNSSLANVTFTYNGVVQNFSYITWFEVYLDGQLMANESRTWHEGAGGFLGNLPGWDVDVQEDIQTTTSIILLLVWIMLFARKHAAFGGVSAMMWATLLRWMGWFPINVWWLAIAWVIAILAFITEGVKK